MRREVADGTYAERVARDERGAVAAGITGTPAFFVNGVLHEGAFDAGSLVEALEAPAGGGEDAAQSRRATRRVIAPP